jgi:hypothetical protein
MALVVVRNDGGDLEEIGLAVDQPSESGLGLREVVVLARGGRRDPGA